MPAEEIRLSKPLWYLSVSTIREILARLTILHDFQVDKFAQVRKDSSQTITVQPPIKRGNFTQVKNDRETKRD